MRVSQLSAADLRSVWPVPPLARRGDAAGSLDLAESRRVVEHILAGGVRRLLYGGNAFLYHFRMAEYEELLEWLSGLPEECTIVPSAGPSFGRAMDQAAVARRRRFPAVMMLPGGDPRDAAGLEEGLRRIAEAAAVPLILYVKDDSNFGADQERGLDAVARLVDQGVAVGIKYAVARTDPADDPYLASLLRRVDPSKVLSGIGERPAVTHLRQWKLPGFTTGSGCLAPALSRGIFEACAAGDFGRAVELRAAFLPLEDFRDSWGPARVLHAATEAAGVARTGAIPPFVSPLSAAQIERLRPVARALVERNRRAVESELVSSPPA